MADKLIGRFRKYIAAKSLFTDDDKLLLAVSGGVDSMVLLHLFSRLDYRYGVAHCNFHLRDLEGDEDALSVEEAARSLGAEHFNIDFDTRAEADATGESIEMAARRLRYGWFQQLCEEHGYTKIVIAHHSDDSIETFFINLIRGTGLRGLTGIHATRGNIVRPLLFATRREILDYAHQNKVGFRQDSSNLSTKYLRNKIRLGVIPRIREISPQFGPTMTGNVERLSSALLFIDRQMDRIRTEITHTLGTSTVIPVDAIDPLLPRGYVIFELLRPYGFSSEAVADLLHGLEAGRSGIRFFSHTHVVYLDRRNLIVQEIRRGGAYRLSVEPDTTNLYGLGGMLTFETLEIEDVGPLQQPPEVALLDAGKIRYPLTVRIWEEGDTFIPFGMTGHKKVSDYLIDEKVALPDKEQQLVVESDGTIVWLVGRRIDDRYKVTETTTHVLRIARQESDEAMFA
jgi:tRNA(Ile)-lysidine synthase